MHMLQCWCNSRLWHPQSVHHAHASVLVQLKIMASPVSAPCTCCSVGATQDHGIPSQCTMHMLKCWCNSRLWHPHSVHHAHASVLVQLKIMASPVSALCTCWSVGATQDHGIPSQCTMHMLQCWCNSRLWHPQSVHHANASVLVQLKIMASPVSALCTCWSVGATQDYGIPNQCTMHMLQCWCNSRSWHPHPVHYAHAAVLVQLNNLASQSVECEVNFLIKCIFTLKSFNFLKEILEKAKWWLIAEHNCTVIMAAWFTIKRPCG